jgi:serine/threonine-protein kinase
LTSPRRKRGLILAAIVVLLALVGGGAGWYFGAGPGSYIAVPTVAGQTLDVASTALKAAGFVVSDDAINSIDVPVGQAVGTDPAAATRIPRGAKVTVHISLGPKIIDVPVLAGLPQAQAEATIKTSGFVLGKVTPVFDAKVPAGTVIAATDGANAALPKTYPEGGTVNLTVSAGPMPDVVGKPQAEALATLTAAGLKPTVGPEAYSSSVAKGSVVSVASDKPVISPGDTVTVTVSKGPEMIQVPNFLGGSWVISDAITKLKSLGFDVRTNIAPALQKYVPVTSQDPAGGQLAPKGSTVTVNGPS